MGRATGTVENFMADARPVSWWPGRGERALGWRRYGAALLHRVADHLSPGTSSDRSDGPELRHLLELPGSARLDFVALKRGEVRMLYSATDAIWNKRSCNGAVVDMREHVRRLCMVAHEMEFRDLGIALRGVGHNLKLAYSLTDVFADTDVEGTSGWCVTAADFEAADGQMTEQHLAATIVFNFVWTAYELVVDAMVPGSGGGKGAKGRNLVVSRARGHVPHLREVLLEALELEPGSKGFDEPVMRRMLGSRSIPGVAAEHVRRFRNRMTHGEVRKPMPRDWGEGLMDVAREDPHLRRFHLNARLVLLLMQSLMIVGLAKGSEIEAWLEEPRDARQVLATLHCDWPARDDEPELNFAVQRLSSS